MSASPATSTAARREQFLANAESLGRQVWDHCVRITGGGVTWRRPGSESRGEPVDIQKRIDPFLYDGTSGIALFLAALARVTGITEWRDRSLEAIAPVRRQMAGLAADPERASRLTGLGIGGMIGLGSLLYSFLRLGELLGEPAFLGEAHDLLALMTPERITADSSCDVLYGGAGAILALLALHRSAPEPGGNGCTPLQTASACARNLLARQQSFDGSPRTWRSLPGLAPLGGFSHGAAGICYALLRLFQQTGEPGLLESAREGLAFERTLYSPERKGWRDPKSAGEPRFAAGWCLGAAGGTLARLPAIDVFATPEIQEELIHGLETTRSAPLETVDHLCCGTLGRVEILLRISEMNEDRELRCAAEDLTREILLRAADAGSFRWRLDMPAGPFDPTFFTGASGAGYTLLRLAGVRSLPCVLALD